MPVRGYCSSCRDSRLHPRVRRRTVWMRCARPTRRRTTRTTVRCGSSWSPPVTSLAAALTAALVAEPASRPAAKQQPVARARAPGCGRGLLLRTAISRVGGLEESMRQRAFVLVSIFTLMAGAVVLSAQVTTKFKAEHERHRTAARDLAIKKGLSEGELLRNAISSPFKRPAAKIQKVLPGSIVSVTVTGEFPSGTTFLSERDSVTISGATQTTTSYSARLTIPPGEAPGYVRLFAVTP